MKNIVRRSPGMPPEYMMVRKDYLTELHRSRAESRRAVASWRKAYTQALVELDGWRQEKQQEWFDGFSGKRQRDVEALRQRAELAEQRLAAVPVVALKQYWYGIIDSNRQNNVDVIQRWLATLPVPEPEEVQP